MKERLELDSGDFFSIRTNGLKIESLFHLYRWYVYFYYDEFDKYIIIDIVKKFYYVFQVY